MVRVVMAVLLGSLVFGCAPSAAAERHIESFSFGWHVDRTSSANVCTVASGDECGAGEEGSEAGQFSDPSGVAVSDATGNVYVVDRGNARVEIFSATGAYISQFDGSAAPTGAFLSPTAIAVDNSTSALDPSSGDLYVLDAGHDVIDKFDSSGVYEGQLTAGEGATPFGELDGVAVDPAGEVWVYQASNEIDNYSDAPANAFIAARHSPFGTNPGFAVDAEDNLYVLRGEPKFGKLSSSGEVLVETVDEAQASTAAAVELANDDVFIDDVSTVGLFSSSGALIERFGSGELASGSGIAVNPGSGAVYVADSAAAKVDVFTLEAHTAPAVTPASLAAESITSTSAELSAEVSAGGDSTTYYFQYGTASCVANPSACSELPTPPGSQLGSGFGEQSASVRVQGLAPDTTYHYRVLASNALGTVASAEAEFTTAPAAVAALTLPDERAWEMVSPPDKHGGLIQALTFEGGAVRASEDGRALTYLSFQPIAAQPGGDANLSQTLSTRGAEGWSSQDISPPHDAPPYQFVGPGQEYRAFSSNLSLAALSQENNRDFTPLSANATEKTVYLRADQPLAPEPAEQANYLTSEGDGGFLPLVTAANVLPGVKFGEHLGFLDATPDLDHVILTSESALVSPPSIEPAEAKPGLYEWTAGSLELASVLPDGKPAAEPPVEEDAQLGASNRDLRHAVADDGSRIVWTTKPSQHLYLRDATVQKTIQIDTAEGVAEPETGGAIFQAASSDDSRIFFTDNQRLTSDSTAEERAPNLYEFEVTSGAGEPLRGKLTDLTPVAGANVQGTALGTSEDGSDVYFVADGVLSHNINDQHEKALPGGCSYLGEAPGATCNLYVSHYSASDRRWEEPTFIAVLSDADHNDWGESEAQEGGLHSMTSRVAPGGDYLAFMSERSLTGYDNSDARSGQADEEVFLYRAATGHLICASCNPSGERPTGLFVTETGNPLVDPLPHPIWEERWLAASVPGWTANGGAALYQSRYLTDTGRLFFDSADGLVPQDVNGKEDVYEYEPQGVGGCTAASEAFRASNDGCVDLISSGSSAEESAFLEASASGNDSFFLTSAALAPQDHDEELDVYDAHVCSAAAPCSAVPSLQPPPCTTGDSCKAAPSPQPTIFGAPPTATFNGAGNRTSKRLVERRARALPGAQKRAAAIRRCRRKPARERAACVRSARGHDRRRSRPTLRRGSK